MDMTQLFEEKIAAEKKIAEVRAEFKKHATELVFVRLSSVFDKYPAVNSVIWTMYAPYFNDGEPCEFSSHHDDCVVTFVEGQFPDWAGDREDTYKGGYELPYIPEVSKYTDQEYVDEAKAKFGVYGDLVSDIRAALEPFSDDDMRVMFTEDGKVEVFRDGQVEVGDYDHD